MTIDQDWNEGKLKPTQAKRQHYIPEMYLKRFARGDGKIRVTDLLEGRNYITSLNNVAVRSRFYDFRADGQNYSAEDSLARIESAAAPILTKLADEPSSITTLTDEQEDSLARFIAVLFFRTPLRWQHVGNMIDANCAEVAKKGMPYLVNECGYGEDEVIAAYREYRASPSYQEQKSIKLTSTVHYLLGEVQGFAQLLRAAPWRLGRVLGPLKLFTSDDPVVRYSPSYRRSKMPKAFFEYDYYLALSPDVLLQVYPRPPSNGTNGDLPWGGRQSKDFAAWEVKIASDLIWRNANRFLYDQGSILLDNSQNFA